MDSFLSPQGSEEINFQTPNSYVDIQDVKQDKYYSSKI